MKRRNFILSLVAGLGAVFAAVYFFFLDNETDLSAATPQFLPLIWDAETIQNIGTRYRKEFPSEDSERALVKLLLPKPTEDTITSDFKNGNIVIIDGWILSVTEARQCALTSVTINVVDHVYRREKSS